MQEHFEQEIESLKTNLLKMASLVDDQVERAVASLESDNIDLCKSVKPRDIEVDAFDNLIQAQSENILALFHPVAIDLRLVISVLMINNQLERCGDIAVNIAQRVKKTFAHKDLIKEIKVVEMGQKAKEMLKLAIDCFIQNNLETATEVLKRDSEVDKLNKVIFKSLIAKMQVDPTLVEPCAHLIVLTRHIERLADHATNIAENLIFYLEAEIVAHKKKLKDHEHDEDNYHS